MKPGMPFTAKDCPKCGWPMTPVPYCDRCALCCQKDHHGKHEAINPQEYDDWSKEVERASVRSEP